MYTILQLSKIRKDGRLEKVDPGAQTIAQLNILAMTHRAELVTKSEKPACPKCHDTGGWLDYPHNEFRPGEPSYKIWIPCKRCRPKGSA